MTNRTPPQARYDELDAADRRRLIRATVLIYQTHHDGDDILSFRQLEVIGGLAPLADGATAAELEGLDARDLDTLVSTAVELADHYGLDDEDLDRAVQRARRLADL